MNRKQQILTERCAKYCEQLGLNVVPEIIWTKKEMRDLPIRIRGTRLGRFTWGWCSNRANIIFICYSRHGSLRELDDTLRHELIHFRFPKVGHNNKFNELMKLLKNPLMKWPKWDRIAFIEEKTTIYMEWAFRNTIHYAGRLA